MRRKWMSFGFFGLLAATAVVAARAGEGAAPPAPEAPEPVVIGPIEGTVTADRVNLRTGPGRTADCVILGHFASKGDAVTVWRQQGEWYEISPPKAMPCWIFGRYVSVPEGTDLAAGAAVGAVKGDKVRARSAGDLHGHILAELPADTPLAVLKEANGWYQVEPPAPVRVWVFTKFVELGEAVAVAPPDDPTGTTDPAPGVERAEREKEAEKLLGRMKSLIADGNLRGAREIKGLLTVDYADTAAAAEAAGIEVPAEGVVGPVAPPPAASEKLERAEALYAEWVKGEVVGTGAGRTVDLVKLYFDVMQASAEGEPAHEKAKERLAEIRLRLDGQTKASQAQIDRLKERIAEIHEEHTKELARTGNFAGSGRLERMPELWGRPGTHRLRKGGVVLYYLKAGHAGLNLDEQVGRRVGVYGEVSLGPAGWGGQVIEVTKVVVLNQ